MKKMCRMLFTIIAFFCLINFVSAETGYGELRYEITKLNITDNKIIFKGWAFIGRTQNGRDEKGKDTEQQIKITAKVGSNTYTKIVHGDNSSGNWNFFYENYWRSWDDNCDKECQVKKVYNGKKYTYEGKTWDNTCQKDNYNSQCYYENIGFTIVFDVSTWEIENEQDVTFTIAAKNNSYGEWTNEEPVAITSPVASVVNDSKNIEIYDYTATSKLTAMAEDAMFRTKTGGLIDCNGVYCIIDPKLEYDISNINDNYIRSTDNKYPFNTIGSGMYAIKVDSKSSDCEHMPKKEDGSPTKGCLKPGNDTSYYVYTSWMKATGNFKIKIKGYKKCSPDNPKNEKLNCNENKAYKNECDHLTIFSDKYKVENNKFYDFRVDIKFNQKITISSVLTPDRTYSGGGFKFNVIYNNDISWDYFGDGNISCTVINNDGTVISKECNNEKIKEIIEEKLNEKIYTIYDLESKINLTATEHKNNKINFIKKCYGNDKFSGKKMKAVCLFTLPKAEMDKYSGVIAKYNIDISNLDVNNKYFTGLNDIGNYIIKPTISGLNRFDDLVAKEDSKDKKSWLGNLIKDFEKCNIELYPLLYTEKGNYRFIYRPIDLNNPFPNRNAGFNWYDWINNENNRERLKNSYSKLQYSINLNSQTINSIKDYNDSHNYLKWDFDGDESDFINKNSTLFNKVRENVGDNS